MKNFILYNAKIYSLDNDNTKYYAIQIENKKIKKLFSSYEEIKNIDLPKIDLHGDTILPAFIESHLHFLMTAISMVAGFPVSSLYGNKIEPTDISSALKLIGEKIINCKKGVMNVASNYMTSTIKERRLPTKNELDEVTLDRPLTVYTIDGHSCAMNSLALEMIGINSKNHNGILTGQEHDFMQGKITGAMLDGINLPIAYKGICKLINHSLDCGFSTMVCLEGFDDAVNDAAITISKLFYPRLPLDIRLYQQYSNLSRASKIFHLLKNKRIGGCGAWEMDGSVGSKSAAFEINYLGENSGNGELYYTDEARDNMFKTANDDGVTISTHAIGSLAIEKALDSFAKIIDNKNVLHHRLDHAEFPFKKDIKRIIKLNLDLAIQPGYAWFDNKFLHSYSNFLPKEIIERELPLKTLLDGNINLCASSDAPVQDINPFLQMEGMIDFPKENEKLTRLEAIWCYTKFPAKSLEEWDMKGSLEIGKSADLGIYSDDYFEIPLSELNTLRCKKLFKDGKEIKKMLGTQTEMVLTLLKKRKKI